MIVSTAYGGGEGEEKARGTFTCSGGRLGGEGRGISHANIPCWFSVSETRTRHGQSVVDDVKSQHTLVERVLSEEGRWVNGEESARTQANDS